jgi:cysteine desulfurase
LQGQQKQCVFYLSDEKKNAREELAVKAKIFLFDGKPGIHIFSPINDKFAFQVFCALL